MTEAERASSFVTQAGHGFSRGQCVKFDGVNWTIAQTGVAGVGLVGSLKDASTFEFVQLGLLEDLDGLTPGAAYYPSETGGLTLTPNGTAIGLAYDSSTFYIQPVSQGALGYKEAKALEGFDPADYATTEVLGVAIATEASRANAAIAAEASRADAAIAAEAIRADSVVAAAIAAEVTRANAAYLEETQASAIGLDILSSPTTRDVREDIQIEPASSTLAYTGPLLTLITDAYGTKTLAYDVNNRLTGVTGTGKYRSKTYAYTGAQLTSITVI